MLCIFIIRLIVGLIEKGRCPNHWNVFFFSKLIYSEGRMKVSLLWINCDFAVSL